MMERLQKIIARAGLTSRRKAEELIRDGLVTVNGRVTTELGTKADPARDHIKVAGKLLRLPEAPVYLLLNKPRGCLTSASDPEGRPTIYGLLRGLRERVFPVGRLEYHAEGLLFLTTDGALAQWWTQAELPQTYWIKIKGKLSREEMEPLRGKLGRDETTVRLLKDAPNAWYECTLRESRRDRLRPALLRLGHPVEKMKRVRLGPLELGRLEPGAWRHLTTKELERIQRLRSATRPATRLPRAV